MSHIIDEQVVDPSEKWRHESMDATHPVEILERVSKEASQSMVLSADDLPRMFDNAYSHTLHVSFQNAVAIQHLKGLRVVPREL